MAAKRWCRRRAFNELGGRVVFDGQSSFRCRGKKGGASIMLRQTCVRQPYMSALSGAVLRFVCGGAIHTHISRRQSELLPTLQQQMHSNIWPKPPKSSGHVIRFKHSSSYNRRCAHRNKLKHCPTMTCSSQFAYDLLIADAR